MKDKPLWIGFHRIDAAIGGLQQGQITIISSDDEIALKALEYSIIRNVGVEQNRSAALFTLTSTKEEASLHLLSSTSKINRENLSSGFISEKDWVTLTRAAGELSDASIFIDDSPAITTKEMFQKCLKLINNSPLDLLIIDSRSRIQCDKEAIDLEIKRLSSAISASVIVIEPQLYKKVDAEYVTTDYGIDMSLYDNVLHFGIGLRKENEKVPTAANLHLLKSTTGSKGVVPVDYLFNESSVLDRLPLDSDPSLPVITNLCNEEVKKWLAKHPNELRKASSRVFEQIMKELFKSQGYNVELTAQTRDGGVDLIAVRKVWPDYEFRVIIECKRYQEHRAVSVNVVRGLSFLIEKFKADRAMLVTTSRFSNNAESEALHPSLWRVDLKDFNAIREWFEDYYNYLVCDKKNS